MKRPTMLLSVLLVELATQLGLSAERDVATLRHRCKHEGLAFITLTLPILSDALESGLESGRFSCPSNFSAQGSLPRFLGGFFKRVFTVSGGLLDDPCHDSVFAIRQISRFMKKLKSNCTPARELDAVRNYIEVEDELRMATSTIIGRKDVILDQVSKILWTQVFPEFDPNSLVCRHGPGVTAERYGSNERYTIRKWPTRSELLFPADLHAFPNYWEASGPAGGGSSCPGLDFLDVGEEPAVRVVFVPKTLKAPRVIAIEPSHMQYMQQGLMAHVVSVLESHRLTKRSVRFSDQSVNQRLAHRSSIDRRLATLDLKDASDRVHLALVQRIFRSTTLLEYLEDCRSLHAILPNGRNVILSKFASMGSALCFPVEAMVFYTLLQAAMHSQDGRRPTTRSIEQYSRTIDIYGDDLIVPVEYVDTIVATLEDYSLKVNVRKSFRYSQFRESCGGDYFAGTDVKPVYLREIPLDQRRAWTASTCMSLAATSDQFYLKGLWKTAQCIRDMLQEGSKTPIPRSRRPGAGLRFHSLLFDTNCRYNSNLHRYEQRRIKYEPIRKSDHIDGQGLPCLSKWGISTVFQRGAPEGSPSWVHGNHQAERQSNHRGTSIFGSLPSVVSGSESFDSSPNAAQRQTERLLSHYGLLAKLHGNPVEGTSLDFDSSVKRGCFKQKSRWIAC